MENIEDHLPAEGKIEIIVTGDTLSMRINLEHAGDGDVIGILAKALVNTCYRIADEHDCEEKTCQAKEYAKTIAQVLSMVTGIGRLKEIKTA